MNDVLPMDSDGSIEALLSEQDEAARHAILVERAAQADSMSFMVAIGRRLRAEHERLAEYQQARDRMMAEYDAAMAPIGKHIGDLEDILEGIALVRREAKKGLSVDIPGLGRVSTKASAPRWAVDNAVVLRDLAGDDRKTFIDPGEPKPAEPKVKGDVLRRHLDDLFKTGVESIRADDEMPRERRMQHIADTVAGLFPGVQWVAPEVTAKVEIR